MAFHRNPIQVVIRTSVCLLFVIKLVIERQTTRQELGEDTLLDFMISYSKHK